MENIKEILYSLIDVVILYAVPALITIGILGALAVILWDCIDRVKKWRKKRGRHIDSSIRKSYAQKKKSARNCSRQSWQRS